MTKQEIFDRVVARLAAQGGPAIDGVQCRYRAPNGARCAIGHLIPDHAYLAAMENYPVSDPMIIKALAEAGIDTESTSSIRFLTDLQIAHDTATRCYEYEKNRWLWSSEETNIVQMLDINARFFNLSFTNDQKAAFRLV